MLSFLLLPAALLSLCAEASPIARHQLRGVNQVYDGPSYNLTTPNRTCNGTDAYNLYTGDGSSSDGWPSIEQWASFDYLWTANLPLINGSCVNIGASGPNNSPEETAAVGSSILAVASTTNIDPRFILAIMMQESKGCVRVQTTYGSHANPGLMQSHAGPNSCVGTTPCPSETITNMLLDGVSGTRSGDGLAATMDQLSASNATSGTNCSQQQTYYRAARMYNPGSIASSGNLGDGLGATNCYVSDIANRLTGWVFAGSTCTSQSAMGSAGAYTGPPASAGNSTTATTTLSCVLVQAGDTCDSVAGELGVSLETFLAANPSVDVECTDLLAGVGYCA